MTTELSHNATAIDHTSRLQSAGLRPTRQRLMICAHLFDGKDKHFTAEELFRELGGERSDAALSLATIYNTLKGFTEAGLLSTLSVDSGKMYYDTNTSHHYHVYDVAGRLLSDLDAKEMTIAGLPDMPEDQEIDRIDVIIRTKPARDVS